MEQDYCVFELFVNQWLLIVRYDDAWDIGILLSDSVQWVKAANAALNDFRLDFGKI